jgi:hypothetical protein
MGYKTADYAEKEQLEKKGYHVIGMKNTHTGLIYEFDFEVETPKETTIEPVKEEVKVIEPVQEKIEPKRRGNPNWFNRGKK